MALQILKIIAAVGTIATGLVSLIAPRSVTGFTRLSPYIWRRILFVPDLECPAPRA